MYIQTCVHSGISYSFKVAGTHTEHLATVSITLQVTDIKVQGELSEAPVLFARMCELALGLYKPFISAATECHFGPPSAK